MLAALLVTLTGAAALQLPARAPAARAPAVRMQAVDPRIEELINENKVMLFMKGNKMFPQCGFSNTVVQILNACETPFETFDVLGDQRIREDIKSYSSWPTIPQARRFASHSRPSSRACQPGRSHARSASLRRSMSRASSSAAVT